jgi:hypothetical protein
MKKILIPAFAVIIICLSCKKEKAPDFLPGDTGSVTIDFDNVVNGNDLELNTRNYTNITGESYSVSTMNYYISNIKLKNADGSEYTVPRDNSYYLIREENASQEIELDDVPAGNYTGISFIIGVDSLRSAAPLSERQGILDPATGSAGMYFDANAGYIFLKVEGHSSTATSADKKFQYHIGGYGGSVTPTFNNIKTITLTGPAGSKAEVRKNKTTPPEIHIFADAAKVFDGAANISIAAHTTVLFEPFSVNVANNYAGMFNINHIHND